MGSCDIWSRPCPQPLCVCTVRLRPLSCTRQAEGEKLFFEEPMRDHIRGISAVKVRRARWLLTAPLVAPASPAHTATHRLLASQLALTQRDEQNASYRSALADLDAKRAAAMKLSGISGRERHLLAAQEEVTKAAARAEKAKEDYDKIARTVLQEVRRWFQLSRSVLSRL